MGNALEIQTFEGEPHFLDGRTVLKRTVDRLAELGLRAVLATEPQSPVLGRGSRQASGLATAAHLADLRGLMAVLVGDGHDGLRA